MFAIKPLYLYDNEETKSLGQWYGNLHRLLFALSLIFFLIGVAIAVLGLLFNYPAR
jgi:hypothetical protein